MNNSCRVVFFLVSIVITITLCQENSAEEVNYYRSQIYSTNIPETKTVRTRAYQSQSLIQNQVHGNENGRLGVGDSISSQAQQLRKPFPLEVENFHNVIPNRPQPQNKKAALKLKEIIEEEEELDKEEPDRLSELLRSSNFDCSGKSTGYYADEGLECEVFHYCQDNTKHSWICPDGFTFHQVHLICMPPSNDNICKKSSQYHFVNEYLYKPLNAEEAQTRPNVTLRYSDRFYPSEVYHDARFDDDEESGEKEQIQIINQRRIPVRPVTASPQPTPITLRRPQVFRSAEEVDIPLLQRRPAQIPQPFHPSNNHDFEYEK